MASGRQIRVSGSCRVGCNHLQADHDCLLVGMWRAGSRFEAFDSDLPRLISMIKVFGPLSRTRLGVVYGGVRVGFRASVRKKTWLYMVISVCCESDFGP